MQQIKSFGRTEHALVSSKVLAALSAIEAELGVTFGTSGGQIGSSGGRINLTVNVKDTGNGMSGAESQFRAWAGRYGVDPDAYGKEFPVNGTRYRLSGINLNAPKFPFMAERVADGASYKFTQSTVSRHFPAKKGA